MHPKTLNFPKVNQWGIERGEIEKCKVKLLEKKRETKKQTNKMIRRLTNDIIKYVMDTIRNYHGTYRRY